MKESELFFFTLQSSEPHYSAVHFHPGRGQLQCARVGLHTTVHRPHHKLAAVHRTRHILTCQGLSVNIHVQGC